MADETIEQADQISKTDARRAKAAAAKAYRSANYEKARAAERLREGRRKDQKAQRRKQRRLLMSPDELAVLAAAQRRWRETNPEKAKAFAKKYRAAHLAEISDHLKTPEARAQRRIYAKASYQRNKALIRERVRAERKQNPLPAREAARARRTANPEKARAYQRAYYAKTAEKRRLEAQLSRERNSDKIKEREKARQPRQAALRRARYANRLNVRIAACLRARLFAVLKRRGSGGTAIRELGCTIEEFRAYIESRFLPGMSWDVWGQRGFHIDHIRPLASFDLTDHSQLLAACHYTNLQPLWWRDNLRKSAKLPNYVQN